MENVSWLLLASLKKIMKDHELSNKINSLQMQINSLKGALGRESFLLQSQTELKFQKNQIQALIIQLAELQLKLNLSSRIFVDQD